MKTPCINAKFATTILLAASIFNTYSHAQIDLHAHLDIKPGVGPLLRGNFNEPTISSTWTSRTTSKASFESLEKLKHRRIVVMSFYAHPYLSVSEAAEIEYAHITEFVKSHTENYEIVRNAGEAASALARNKTAIVLSIEGADGLLDTDADFKKWIDDRGVAMVTPFHLTEDKLGGTAFMGNYLLGLINSPLDYLRALWNSKGACLRTICKSTIGIKPPGRALLDRLIEKKVWIDLSHSNEIQVQEILREYENKNLPMLVTHTQIREVHSIERALGEQERNYLAKHDGIIGLIPTHDMINEEHAKKLMGLKQECYSSLEAFRHILQTTARQYGIEKVTLGTDINAPLNGLSPLCEHANSDLEKNGFYTYSQIEALEDHVAPSPDWTKKTQTHFLKLWKQVRP